MKMTNIIERHICTVKCKLDENIESEYNSIAKPKKIVTVRVVR